MDENLNINKTKINNNKQDIQDKINNEKELEINNTYNIELNSKVNTFVGAGTAFALMTEIFFLIIKIFHLTKMSWLWVLSPIWILVIVVLCIAVISIIKLYLTTNVKH